jgi:hypothetical protein
MYCPICKIKGKTVSTFSQKDCTIRKCKCPQCKTYYFTKETFYRFTEPYRQKKEIDLNKVALELDKYVEKDDEQVKIIAPEGKIEFGRLEDFL